MKTNFNKKRRINFFSRVRITKYLQLFDLDAGRKSFWVAPESYVFFKSVKTDWSEQLKWFFLNERGAARPDFVERLSSFNYLNFDIRSLLVKYRCFFRKNSITAAALYVIISRVVWFFFLSFIFFVWFLLFFFVYVWVFGAEVVVNVWLWCDNWAFFLYLDGLFSWFLFPILKLLVAANSTDWIVLNIFSFWNFFIYWCLSYLNFFFIGWEASMSSFEFFGNISDQLIWNKIWVALGFFGITLVVLGILLFVIFYGFLRTDLWVLALKWFYGGDYARGIPAVETLNQAAGLVFANNVSFNSLRLNSSNYQDLYFDFLQNQTFGGFVGFIDLFPAYDSVFNYSNFLNKRFRRQSFNRGLSIALTQYWHLSAPARNYLRRRTYSLNFQLLKSVTIKGVRSQFWQPSHMISFISDRFYAIPRLQLATNFFGGFNVLRFFRNVSVSGEFNVQKLRSRLFLALTRKKDPWFFSAAVPDLHEFKASTSKDLVNWYARELNSVVLSRTLRGKVSFFNSYSVSRFRFGWQNLVNDYSFWRTPSNAHNTFEYTDVFFAIPEEEDYSGASHLVRAEDVLDESEIGEEDPEEYVDESVEMFFEDGLLHKSLDAILFDDEVDEALADVGVSDSEIDAFDGEEFVDFLNNRGVIYKAGQERDYTVTTYSKDYSGTYGLEYDQSKAYLEQVFSSFYDELVDLYWIGGFKTFYLNLLEYPTSRVFGVWPISKVFNLRRVAKRIQVGRLLEFYRQQSTSLFIPPYGRLITNFLVTNVFFVCAGMVIVFCCLGLWFSVSVDLFIEAYVLLFCFSVGLLFFLSITGFVVAIQFFYGPWLAFFFVAELSLCMFGYMLGFFLSECRPLEVFKSLQNRRNLDASLLNLDLFISKLVGRHGFILLPIQSFFIKSLPFNKSVFAAEGLVMLRNSLLVVGAESYFIDLTRGLRKFWLLGGASSSLLVSNNSIRDNYSFFFVNSFEMDVLWGCNRLRCAGRPTGVMLSAFDFYYADNNFLYLRKKILPVSARALVLGEAGISDGVIFRGVGRVVSKLRFTPQGSQLVGLDPDFLEDFGRSMKGNGNSLWSSDSKVDNYFYAFTFFSSLEWTKALWSAEYELNSDVFGGVADGVSSYENASFFVFKSSPAAESFEKAGFSQTQKFKFLGANLPGIADRFHKTEGREFIRLFLANKVMATNYAIKNVSETSSLFETLFYSSFFDVRAVDKFYTKGDL